MILHAEPAAPHPWSGRRIPDMVEACARRWPDRVALLDGDVRVSFAELRDQMNAVAANLHAVGIREGDHVATFLRESAKHVALIYGILRAGAVVVPLNLVWESAEIEQALRDADVDVLVAGTMHRGQDLTARLAPLALERADSHPALPRLRQVIREGNGEASDSFERLFSAPTAPAPDSRNQLGFLMFTSGSSAAPKAALIGQSAALGCAYYYAERLSLDADDRLLNVFPFYHCGGLINVLLTAHQSGASVRIFEGVQVDPMVDAIWTDHSTVLISFDVVTTRLFAESLRRHDRIPFDRIISSPGINTYDKFQELHVDHAIIYALTEASNLVSITSATDEETFKRESNGFSPPGIAVRICDIDTGAEVAAGAPGEICFKGWNLMHGYYRSQQPPLLRLDGDGFFHTGDYGYRDTDGRVYYRGRYSAMVKTGGENVSQVEVENFLMSHIEGVRQAAVIGIPDEKWGEAVVAFIELSEGCIRTAEQVRDACRGKLTSFKIPKKMLFVQPGQWPVTLTGKIRKPDLVDWAVAESAEPP